MATVGGELYSEPVELQLTGESLELDLQAYAVYAVAYRVVDASTGGPPISGPGALIFGANSYRAEGASVDHLRRGAGRPIVEARCQEIERQLPDGVQVRFMLGSCGAPPKLIYSVHLLGYERARGALPMFPLENAAESIESVELRQEAASWGSVRLELEGEPLDPMGGTLSGENAVVYLTDARTRQQSMHVLRLTADAHELRVPESVYEVRVDSIHDVGRRDLPVSRAVFEVSAGESVDLDVSFAGFGHVRVVPDRELTKGEPFRVMLEDSEGSYATHRLEEGASMLYGVAPGEYSLHLLSVGGFSFQVDGSRSVPVVVRGDEVAIAVLPF